MKRLILGLVILLSTVFGAQAAEAVEFCLGLSGFGNVFRLEAVNFGAAIFGIVGHDRVFEERAVAGSLYVGSTFAAIGFTDHGSTFTAHLRGFLSLATGSGPYQLQFNNSSAVTPGTMSAISCAGVPARAGEMPQSGQPDIGSVLAK